MLKFFKHYRQKKKQDLERLSPRQLRNFVKEFSIGDMVRLKFKDPTEMGFTTVNDITYTRFNSSELINRIISGTVSKNWYEDYPLHEQLIEVTVVREKGMIRKYLFLAQEIESIIKL